MVSMISYLSAALLAVSASSSDESGAGLANHALIYGTPEYAAATARPAGPIRLAPGPHLFLDEYLIESSAGITRKVNQPARSAQIPHPIVTGAGDRCFQPFFTVSRQPETGRFRIWYGVWRDDRSKGASHLATMESADGIHWQRPTKILDDPGPLQFGSEVLDRGPSHPDPKQRYVYSWWHSGGLRIATSPDGLHFRPLTPDVVLAHGHDITNIWRDPIRNRYVATVSEMLQLEHMGQKRRTTLQAASPDLIHWSPKWVALASDQRYDPAVLQFYAMNAFAARGGLVIGIAKNLHDDWQVEGRPKGAYGVGSSSLAWTRDGRTWVRDRDVFFGPDPRPGAWDHAHAWIDEQLPVGQEVYLYYAGYKWGHKHNRFDERQIGLVRMPRDRYVARQATAQGGLLRTPPVVLAGAAITVNAKIEGQLRLRLVDVDGRPMQGFDWVTLTGDKVDHPVAFREKFEQLGGRPARLEFELRNAQLFGFDLQPGVQTSSAPAAGQWMFAASADNDLYRAIQRGGTACARFDRAEDAVANASVGTAVLVLADGYPERTTTISPSLLQQATAKRLRLYLEYPEALPGVTLGPPHGAKKERAVVSSELFAPALKPLEILAVHGCRLVKAELPATARVHLVWAKVAGVDRAVFGLNDTPAEPLLFDYGQGSLVATTRLSSFVSGRYMPNESWRGVWRAILGHLQPGCPVPELKWTPTVRPAYGRDEPLPPDAETQALRRLADWYRKARVLRHPAWPKAALDRAATYNTVLDPPAAGWPTGDGSLGVLEGYSSTIRADGSQPMRYAVRNDCNCEVAMALAFAQRFTHRPADGQMAAHLIDYTWRHSPLVAGPRADPQSDSFGLIGWALDHPGTYYGDDNARALLGGLAVARLQGVARWDAVVLRCLEANLRTTGVNGYRESCLTDETLAKRGWQSFARGKPIMRSPHFEAWLWACFLWAYERTHHEPYLTLTKAGFRDLMENYPDRWHWVIRSGQIERARALLPLAWLVRVDDTAEHRRWLGRIADDVLAWQDACGAIRERLGGVGQAVGANRDYGTGEVSIIQQDGDPVADMLYTCNFAVVGLHEAAAATGEPRYRQAEDRLAAFLCRIQIRSDAHPELDGAWYRAFDCRRWDYWASNADWEWGPWCTETGWTQPWIAATLALRRMNTSLWELVTKTPAEPVR